MARRDRTESPAPLTSSELLDYIAGLQGKQVHPYKRLAGGIARSSYSIHYYPESRTFDTFSSISDDWFEATREQFIACHGDGERSWHLDIKPTPKTTQPPDLLIAIYNDSADANMIRREPPSPNKRRNRTRCQICRKVLRPVTRFIQGSPMCDDCGMLHIEGKDYYGIRFGVEVCSASHGQYTTLQSAVKQVRMLDRMGYDFLVFRGREHWGRDDEVLHWIPILRLEAKEVDTVNLNDFPENIRVTMAEEIRLWREQRGAEKIL